MAEQRLKGQVASPGLAAGAVVRLEDARRERVPTGDAAGEAAALRAALSASADELSRLVDGLEGDAADVLAFQIAMLEDEALAEGAFHAIEAGIAADHAWNEAMAAEITGYEAADDPYFQARATDIADIRDRVAGHLVGNGAAAPIPSGAIVIAHDLTPSRFLSIDWKAGGAIALVDGSPSSHVAMLARARGVPMIASLGAMPTAGSRALVDGEAGTLVIDPDDAALRAFEARRSQAAAEAAKVEAFRLQPARMASGEAVAVLINVAEPEELDALDPSICDGIGLTRTEFLFHSGSGLPDEEAQTRVYSRIAAWAKGRPVTIRTLDAGGDKPIAGLTIEETNPFLGLRGIRLSLARTDVFRVQLRALARASVAGNIKVMVPMVTIPDEMVRVSTLLDEEIASLKSAGIACARPSLGMMVEVPAAAICADRFGVDFYSIGSNDLTQYTLAASRDSGAVAALSDAGHPAVLDLIARTVDAGRRRGVEVSLCGDAGADLALLPRLLATGLRAVSVAPVAVARVKAAIASCSSGQ